MMDLFQMYTTENTEYQNNDDEHQVSLTPNALLWNSENTAGTPAFAGYEPQGATDSMEGLYGSTANAALQIHT